MNNVATIRVSKILISIIVLIGLVEYAWLIAHYL